MVTLLFQLVHWCSIPIEGWVISILWGWFVHPLGVQNIGAMHGAGLSLLLCVMRPLHIPLEDETIEHKLARVLMAFVIPLCALVIGCLIHVSM